MCLPRRNRTSLGPCVVGTRTYYFNAQRERLIISNRLIVNSRLKDKQMTLCFLTGVVSDRLIVSRRLVVSNRLKGRSPFKTSTSPSPKGEGDRGGEVFRR